MYQTSTTQVCVGLFVVIIILAAFNSCSKTPSATTTPNSTPVSKPTDATTPYPPQDRTEPLVIFVSVIPATPTPEPTQTNSPVLEATKQNTVLITPTVVQTSSEIRIERLTYSLTEELENSLERKRAEYNQLVFDLKTAKKILVELRPEMLRTARNAKLAYPRYWRPLWAGACLELKYEIKDLEELILRLSNDISDVEKEGRIISQKIKDLRANGS